MKFIDFLREENTQTISKEELCRKHEEVLKSGDDSKI